MFLCVSEGEERGCVRLRSPSACRAAKLKHPCGGPSPMRPNAIFSLLLLMLCYAMLCLLAD